MEQILLPQALVLIPSKFTLLFLVLSLQLCTALLVQIQEKELQCHSDRSLCLTADTKKLLVTLKLSCRSGYRFFLVCVTNMRNTAGNIIVGAWEASTQPFKQFSFTLCWCNCELCSLGIPNEHRTDGKAASLKQKAYFKKSVVIPHS